MTDFNKILEKAKEIEKKMKESQENLKRIEVKGVSGGDSVTILLNGEGEITKILLSDNVLKEDKEIIQDLIFDLGVLFFGGAFRQRKEIAPVTTMAAAARPENRPIPSIALPGARLRS